MIVSETVTKMIQPRGPFKTGKYASTRMGSTHRELSSYICPSTRHISLGRPDRRGTRGVPATPSCRSMSGADDQAQAIS